MRQDHLPPPMGVPLEPGAYWYKGYTYGYRWTLVEVTRTADRVCVCRDPKDGKVVPVVSMTGDWRGPLVPPPDAVPGPLARWAAAVARAATSAGACAAIGCVAALIVVGAVRVWRLAWGAS